MLCGRLRLAYIGGATDSLTVCRLREVETHCGETYAAYKTALKKNWHQIDEVRKEQSAFENCWRDLKQYNKVRRTGMPRWEALARSRCFSTHRLTTLLHDCMCAGAASLGVGNDGLLLCVHLPTHSTSVEGRPKCELILIAPDNPTQNKPHSGATAGGCGHFLSSASL